MGQRSQIYIRFYDKNENRQELCALYFQWLYGDFMISRARHGIEWMQERKFDMWYYKKYLQKVFEVNFDIRDVTFSCDILKEWAEFEKLGGTTARNYIFYGQDNNDGKLFIDIDKDGNIKYCFTDDELNILSAENYMKWDEPDFLKRPNKNAIETCKNNIEWLNNNAVLMNRKELNNFIDADYSKQLNELLKANAPKF